MERKTLGILALALVGLFAVSMVVAMPFGNAENRDAAREAVEAGDYDAWKAIVSAELTEENFDRMTQMHELKNQIREAKGAGDMETVSALMEEFRELVPEGKSFGKRFGNRHGGVQGRMHGGHSFAN